MLMTQSTCLATLQTARSVSKASRLTHWPEMWVFASPVIHADQQVTGEALQKEQQSYNGRERVLLRKRRTKLRVDQFRIIAQVGQGGYGSVYLARKVDTNEVCALKKMRKGTLAKMDEVKHVLVERDILTATKTPWLVRLLYAFQDREHVYLAMVSLSCARGTGAELSRNTCQAVTLEHC